MTALSGRLKFVTRDLSPYCGSATSNSQVRVEKGEVAFNAWMRYLRATGQSFAAKYWTEQGYALVRNRMPPMGKGGGR